MLPDLLGPSDGAQVVDSSCLSPDPRPVDRFRSLAMLGSALIGGRARLSRAKRIRGAFRVLSFYLLTELDPREEVELHRSWCSSNELTGRVWISDKGASGLASKPLFAQLRLNSHEFHLFSRMV